MTAIAGRLGLCYYSSSWAPLERSFFPYVLSPVRLDPRGPLPCASLRLLACAGLGCVVPPGLVPAWGRAESVRLSSWSSLRF